jgi:hypothetical protein
VVRNALRFLGQYIAVPPLFASLLFLSFCVLVCFGYPVARGAVCRLAFPLVPCNQTDRVRLVVGVRLLRLQHLSSQPSPVWRHAAAQWAASVLPLALDLWRDTSVWKRSRLLSRFANVIHACSAFCNAELILC